MHCVLFAICQYTLFDQAESVVAPPVTATYVIIGLRQVLSEKEHLMVNHMRPTRLVWRRMILHIRFFQLFPHRVDLVVYEILVKLDITTRRFNVLLEIALSFLVFW